MTLKPATGKKSADRDPVPDPLLRNGGRGERDRTGPKWDKGPRPGGKGPHIGSPEKASSPNDGGPEILLKKPQKGSRIGPQLSQGPTDGGPERPWRKAPEVWPI